MKKIKKYIIYVQLQKLFYKRWENQAYTKAYRKKKTKKHGDYKHNSYERIKILFFKLHIRRIKRES
jgi:hypothetical protein